jgi:2,6-dihydroxypseudooxynicotine hydrolase
MLAKHPDPIVDHVLKTWAPRMIVQGIDYNDLMTTGARIRTWNDWPREWSATAAGHEEFARAAEAKGNRHSATEAYLLAAMAYHFACNNSPDDMQQYVHGHKKRVECYAKAAPYLDPPADRHEVPFGPFHMPAYLRRPAGVPQPPVVVIISGLESTKEEARTMEDGFLRRGMATFTFDGPGQGESWFQGGMIVEFERATSAVIDYLAASREVDPNRVGVFGPSMGGYLAPRSAACDERIRACASAGGMYDRTRVLNRLDDPFEFARIAHIWKIYDREKLAELNRRCTLEGLAEKIRCPLLVVHGTKDFVPLDQAQRLYNEASGPKELVILEGGNHVCNNMPFRYRPLIGDFLAKHLGASVAVSGSSFLVTGFRPK